MSEADDMSVPLRLAAHAEEAMQEPMHEPMSPGSPGMLAKVRTHRQLYDSDTESLRAHPSFYAEWMEGRRTDVRTAIFNLVSTIIGGGVLSLPYALSRSGLVMFVVIAVIAAIATDWSVYILVSCSRRSGARTYKEVGESVFGTSASVLITLSITILTLLLLIAYGILLRDIVSAVLTAFHILHADSSHTVKTVVMACSILLVSPLCFFRSLHALRFTSSFSLFAVSTLLVCLAYHSLKAAHDHQHDHQHFKLWPDNITDAIYPFPIFVVAFVCHFNVLPVHGDLIEPSRHRLKRVIHFTIVTVLFMYLLCGITGYSVFYGETKGNIFLNFAATDPAMTVGRVALMFSLMLSYPLLCLPCRSNLLEFVCLVTGKEVPAPGQPETHAQQAARYAATAVVVATAVASSSVLTSVVTVWNLLGSTMGLLVSQILPPLFYLRLRRPSLQSSMTIPAWVLLVFGVLSMVVCTVQSIRDL